MGMAASQARYLALVARKSNCEYEGQQINQSRTVLSNQSANLFNQMLGLNVPVPPSTQDFTKTQYSFQSGPNATVIDKWEQLATPEEEYNYIVTHHYYKDVYTGAQKQINDPQVQFTEGKEANVNEITNAILELTKAETEYNKIKGEYDDLTKKAATLTNYANNETFTKIIDNDYYYGTDSFVVSSNINNTEQTTITRNGKEVGVYLGDDKVLYYKTEDNKYYTLDNQEYTGNTEKLAEYKKQINEFIGHDKLNDEDKSTVDKALQTLISYGALPKEILKDPSSIYYDAKTGSIALKNDLKDLNSNNAGGKVVLPIYKTGEGDGTIDAKTKDYQKELDAKNLELFEALQAKEQAQKKYDSLQRPSYIGNSELTLLTSLTSDQEAALKQIVTDMEKNKIDTSIRDCFGPNGNYLGGVYQYKVAGHTYYTTFEELEKTYASGDGINHIDGQNALTYYNASYVSTKIEETEKALIETDETGRFTSIRFEDDSVTYPLNAEATTDEAAYKDAMNKFNYETAKYDKTIQDINAKTKIIQREDQQLELRLKQLDTEQNALSNEIEAVSKVVKDNIEKSFKTFGG